jgi:hypothetical protein
MTLLERQVKHSRLTIIVAGLLAAVTVSNRGQALRAGLDPPVLAAGIQQPVVDPPWPDQAYRVEWMEAHIPAEVAAGVRIAVPVDVRNSGNRVWPAAQVFVSYHWFRDDRLIVWDGERTVLPRDLRAGSRATLAVHVATPLEPGSYVLKLTLVHELVTWFEHRGATMFSQAVAVRPPARSSECGSGSISCTAAH